MSSEEFDFQIMQAAMRELAGASREEAVRVVRSHPELLDEKVDELFGLFMEQATCPTPTLKSRPPFEAPNIGLLEMNTQPAKPY